MSTEFVEVTAPAGRVRGRWRGAEEGSAAFLGIPFAEPPVAELRFAAPRPKEPWRGVLGALEYGATPQRGATGPTTIPEPSIAGDSTLNVNVFTPSPERPGSACGLPVLVWFHGGSFTAGSPAGPWYDGAAFNRDGVVTVTVSYRLGHDGFGWIDGAPANRGVRDWLLALEWVQENIAAFGGDPARVTIAGQSAGGGAVLTLLGMPAAAHLFHGVYALSGALADVPAGRAERLGRAIAARAGVEPTAAALRSVPEERLLPIQRELTTLSRPWQVAEVTTHGLPIGPMVDGDLLPAPTLDSIRAGVGADKPLVLGTTDDEFLGAVAPLARRLRWAPTRLVLRVMGLERARLGDYLAANRALARAGTARIAGRFLTDAVFRAPALRFAAARAEAPEAATWLYRFAWPSRAAGHAQHCLDVPFFFDCLDRDDVPPVTGPEPPQALADAVHGAAVRLMRTGEPGWERYRAPSMISRVFDETTRDLAGAYAAVAPLVRP
ncbi:carboxylesterase/lipase family protein [Pseudactinotalea sp. HY158]|uniref:carboxylesterase/lipase family protein n=1 Tax=Pseudactinotalea sp. HY158 TaxID=2654547 RepID=UPI00129C6718|nr:carboxylesterase family protein [Pseudactinotalea sp. HY158]QGH70181.1 carboxylesterase family protein [Pseudactinotalea sp. HY158]